MTVSTDAGAAERVPALDELRSLAVLSVLAFHVAQGIVPHGAIDAGAIRVLLAGWLGVDLFFALSGFLITRILLETRSDRGYLRNFWARRALRIMPLYYTLLAALVLLPHGLFDRPSHDPVEHWPAWHAGFASNILIARAGWSAVPAATTPFWSLAVEEQFYLLWPLIVLLLPRRRQLVVACMASLALLPVLRAATLLNGLSGSAIYVLTPFHADGLLVGALVACLEADQLSRWRRQIVRVAWACGAGLVGLFVARHGLMFGDRWVQVAGFTPIAIGSGAVVALALTRGERPDPTVPRRWLRSVGLHSYAIYLLHVPVIYTLDRAVPRVQLPLLWGARLPLAILYAVTAALLTWALSLLAWHLIEKHFLKLKRHFPRRPQQDPRRTQGDPGVNPSLRGTS